MHQHELSVSSTLVTGGAVKRNCFLIKVSMSTSDRSFRIPWQTKQFPHVLRALRRGISRASPEAGSLVDAHCARGPGHPARRVWVRRVPADLALMLPLKAFFRLL